MNIADDPKEVVIPGIYGKEINRVPMIVTGNNFNAIYDPLTRDGRMEKFYWKANEKEKKEMINTLYKNIINEEYVKILIEEFKEENIDFCSNKI